MIRARVGSEPGWSAAARVHPDVEPRRLGHEDALRELEWSDVVQEIELRVHGPWDDGRRTTYWRWRVVPGGPELRETIGPFEVVGPLELVECIKATREARDAWNRGRERDAGGGPIEPR